MLDHLAIRVQDRSAMRDALLDALEWRVLEETDRFTLLGVDADHGKLTLLDADPGTMPRPARLLSIVLAAGEGAETPAPISFPEGLLVTFAANQELGPEFAGTPRDALVGVSMRAMDPPIMAARLEAEHGMHVDAIASDLATLDISEPGSGRLTLHRERWDRDTPGMLDHLGVRVDDAERWRADAEREDIGIVKWVEAPHSKAVFVTGPDDLLIEFVELTKDFEPA
jgi:catechol 2,3-dioxygenase-like lactoylglutathione lyase family enzyme